MVKLVVLYKIIILIFLDDFFDKVYIFDLGMLCLNFYLKDMSEGKEKRIFI